MRKGIIRSAATCACQDVRVIGWACKSGQCDRCDYGEHPDDETVIRRHGGLRPAVFTTPMRHEPATPYATRRTAMVWLADRVCRRVCSCDCHQAHSRPIQLDLFAAVG
jgi:hypothetical protein